jgi:hypothetical protein
MSHVLEVTRALDKATHRDNQERYYRIDHEGAKVFGYHAWQTGAWVCYTCGLGCDCYETSEEVSA